MYKILYSGIYVDKYLNFCNFLIKYFFDCIRYKLCLLFFIFIYSCLVFCDLLINILYIDLERDVKLVFVLFYSFLMIIRVEVNGRIIIELF